MARVLAESPSVRMRVHWWELRPPASLASSSLGMPVGQKDHMHSCEPARICAAVGGDCPCTGELGLLRTAASQGSTWGCTIAPAGLSFKQQRVSATLVFVRFAFVCIVGGDQGACAHEQRRGLASRSAAAARWVTEGVAQGAH